MSLKKVFCTVPWLEVHINADGTYHTCGAQRNSMSGSQDGEVYNVHNMSVSDWANSEYQKSARLKKINGVAESLCSMCYNEEATGSSSKRSRENLKSHISDINFYHDYKHSPDASIFKYSEDNNGLTDILHPISYHMSLGNECNLACKMCNPTFSSKIAAAMVKEKTYSGPIRMNWTDNTQSWNSVIDTMCQTKNLKFVHIIGGEPLLNPRFNELIDRLLQANLTDIYLGFTTNGTMFDSKLLDKLSMFRHVDIGISVEGSGKLNDYIRAQTESVLGNIEHYLKYRKQGRVYVTIRTVPSALSVHTLDDLYRWCIGKEVDVMSNILTTPEYLQIRNLPVSVKQKLLDRYNKWEYSTPLPGISDPRDPTRFREHIDNEIRAVVQSLQQPGDNTLTEALYKNLEAWQWFADPEIKSYFYV